MHGRLWTNCAHWQGCPSLPKPWQITCRTQTTVCWMSQWSNLPAKLLILVEGSRPGRMRAIIHWHQSTLSIGRVLNGNASDAASDSLSAPDDSSDTASDAHPQSASGVDTDNEQLETRGIRLFGLRQSVDDGQNNRRAGKRSRPRGRKQGPRRQLIHPGTEGSKLDRDCNHVPGQAGKRGAPGAKPWVMQTPNLKGVRRTRATARTASADSCERWRH